MSLEPEWYSTMFPLFLAAGLLLGGMAAMTVLVIGLRERGLLPGVTSAHLHGLSRLLCATGAVWAYVWFSQYVLIYYTNLPEEAIYYRRRIDAGGPLFALNVALSEPLRYRAAEQRPHLNRAFMVILGLERFEQFSEIVAAHERGHVPETVMWGACPTLFDPTQAPAGKHVAFMWEKLPYAVHGDPTNWDALKDAHGGEVLRLWTRYAPNLEGAVLDSFVRSPLDTERDLPNMRGGDLLVGSFDGAEQPKS